MFAATSPVGCPVVVERAGWRCAASAVAVLLVAALLALVPSGGPAAAQTPSTACAATTASTDYDTDNDGLIEVCSLAQLNAMRWDLDGDGTADVYRDGSHDTDGATKYAAAFPSPAAGMGCPSTGCEGYELAVDLDFDTNGSSTADAGDTYWNNGKGWTPIGGEYLTPGDRIRWRGRVGIGNGCFYDPSHSCRDTRFSAVFDGNGNEIANLYIADNRHDAGLFGRVDRGTIRNVGLTAPDFGSVSGYDSVGSLVGDLVDGRVSGSWSEVAVSSTYTTVGGLVGAAYRGAVVEGSWASGDVTANYEGGGLVGMLNHSHIAASYATGNVTCKRGNCGGLVGQRSGGGILATYAAGDVEVTEGYQHRSGADWYLPYQLNAVAGGLVGLHVHGSSTRKTEANYSTGQVTAPAGSAGSGGTWGLCRPQPGDTPLVSYWDTEASGMSSSECATGHTTAQLQSPTGYTGIYADWNVDVDGDGSADDPWDFGTTSQYPVLKWGSLDAAVQRAVGMGSPPVVVPELSISGGAGVTEGGAASFTIAASPVPAAPVAVALSVLEDGDWGASAPVLVTVSGASTLVSVSTVDDDVDEADGSVTVFLSDGSGYTVSSTSGSATVSVADDDDPPSLGEQQESQGYVVDAGVVARVEALAGQTHHGTAHVNRWSRVLVAFGVHDGSGVSDGAMTAAQAQEMADKHSSPVWDEVVTELTKLEAAAADEDDDDQPPPPTPVVSVTAGSGVTEGGAATFTVTASPAPASPISVKLAVSEVGSFGASGAATVTLSGATAVYTVTTVDDQVDEADGSVTVTVQDGSGYAVSSSAGSASVAVADDDDPPSQDPPADQDQQQSYVVDAAVVAKVEALAGQTQHGTAHVNRWSRVLVAFGVHDGTGVTGGPMTAAQAQEMADKHSSPVWDEVVAELTKLEASQKAQQDAQQDQQQGQQQDPQVEQVPELSITAGSGVTEGGSASFTITASPAPATPITVKVGVSEIGSFGASGAASVVVSGATTTYTVTTVDDQADEADGSVTVTLQDGSGYTVSSSSGAATAGVADDDVPVVSVAAGSGVTEGGTASFTITASPTPASPISVKVAVSEIGSFGVSGAATVTLSGATATYTVTTTDDDADEADGSVTVTLLGGSGYTVSLTGAAATVGVADDDDPPAQDPLAEKGQQDPPAEDGPIEMSVSDASAAEGSALEFVISLSRAADAPVDVVYVTLEGTASSSDYAFGNDIVTIAAGQTALTVSIATTADSVAEGAERMYFELAAVFGDADVNIADGYALATGTITDN